MKMRVFVKYSNIPATREMDAQATEIFTSRRELNRYIKLATDHAIEHPEVQVTFRLVNLEK